MFSPETKNLYYIVSDLAFRQADISLYHSTLPLHLNHLGHPLQWNFLSQHITTARLGFWTHMWSHQRNQVLKKEAETFNTCTYINSQCLDRRQQNFEMVSLQQRCSNPLLPNQCCKMWRKGGGDSLVLKCWTRYCYREGDGCCFHCKMVHLDTICCRFFIAEVENLQHKTMAIRSVCDMFFLTLCWILVTDLQVSCF